MLSLRCRSEAGNLDRGVLTWLVCRRSRIVAAVQPADASGIQMSTIRSISAKLSPLSMRHCFTTHLAAELVSCT